MRIVVPILLPSAFLIPLIAVAPSISAQNPNGSRLSFDFSTAALRTLDQIENFDGAPEHHVEGSSLTLVALYNSVSSLESVARTRQELISIGGLRGFMEDKLANNDSREDLFQQAWSSYQKKHPKEQNTSKAKAAVKEHMQNQAQLLVMSQREMVCYNDFEVMLQSHAYHDIPSCLNVRAPAGPK